VPSYPKYNFAPNNTPLTQEMILNYNKQVHRIIKPMYDYFLNKIKEVPPLSTNPKKCLKEHAFYRSILFVKFARFWHPSRLSDLHPSFNNIKQQFSPILSFISTNLLTLLETELPNYQTISQKINSNNNPDFLSSFWRRNSQQLPTWFQIYQHLSLCQPSTGAVEHAMSTFNSVSSGKECALEETLEAAVVLRYNYTHL